jgi:hypothetical protein
MPEVINKGVPNPAEEPAKEENDLTIIEQIQEMKRNYIPKDQFEKVVKERDEAYAAMLNGDELPGQENIDNVKSRIDRIHVLRDELFGDSIENSPMTNLDYFKKTLELRDLVMEDGGVDPFLSPATNITQADAEKGEFIAEELRQMIKDSGDDPDAFRALYQARVKDIVNLNTKGR